MREVVLDVETTGLKASDGHRVVELGMVELLDGIPTGRVYSQRFNPKIPFEMDPRAVEVHGITKEMLQHEPTFTQRVNEILSFMYDWERECGHPGEYDGTVFVAHYASFDVEFLNNELMFANCRERLNADKTPIVDTRIFG